MSERYLPKTEPRIELTTQQLATLLLKSQTQSRKNQKRYLKDLCGTGNARELDETLSIACCDQEATDVAKTLYSEWERERSDQARTVSRDASQAVRFFVHSLIAGDFGPNDSRDGRSDAFLKHPHTVARTTEIFLECLLVDLDGKVINHDEAERHARDYLDDVI
jgi:hypothetical protein